MGTAAATAATRAREERERLGLRTDAERRAAAVRLPWRSAVSVPGLRPAQCDALAVAAQLSELGGPYGPLVLHGLGHGKTLAARLLGGAFRGGRIVVLCPANLIRPALAQAEEWGRRFAFPTARIVSYGALSVPSGARLLDDLSPDVLVLDEAHAAADSSTARGGRIAEYLARRPLTRVCALSGTLLGTSIVRLATVASWCLRDLSPLPLEWTTLQTWAEVLDAAGDPDRRAVAGVATALGATIDLGDVPAARTALRRAWAVRLATWPGVSVAGELSCGATILLHRARYAPGEGAVRAVEALRGSWVLPDGSEVVDAPEWHRAARTLPLGFFLRWRGAEPPADWLAARRGWAAAVRAALSARRTPGRDSPGLVEAACRSGGAGPRLAAAWRAWEAVRDGYTPETEAVWYDVASFRRAVEAGRRALGDRPALWWYHHLAVGRALADLGVRVLGAGDDPPTDGRATYALSIGAFGRGHNFQAWSANVVLEPPAGAEAWEQLLGRTHRAGQAADEVVAAVVAEGPAWWGVERAIARAEVASDLSGQVWRLFSGSWVDGLSH